MKTKDRSHFRVLMFKRCGIPFGVDVVHVREIRKFESLRPLALAIHPMIGLVTLGDRIIPVFDPHAFGSAVRQPAGRTLTTIICGEEGAEVALVADEVQNQTEVRAEQLIPHNGANSGWLQGEVAIAPGRRMLLLAVNQLTRLAAVTESELQPA
jgi:chemotaxis signal transduction protein